MRLSCEVAGLPFQAHANHGTWSIDFCSIPSLFSLEGRKKKGEDKNNCVQKLSFFQ